MYPVAPASDSHEPDGHSYGALVVGADELSRPDLLAQLSGIRFSGWVAPPQEGWTVILGDPGDGVVAEGRRGAIEVAGLVAQRAAGPVLAARVRRDRQLGLVAWSGGLEVARYCSDPSQEVGAAKDVIDQPFGAAHGETLARLFGRPDAAEALVELLEDELDPDSVYESERAGRTLRMLGLPAWIVAAGGLPRAMPTGPRTSELVRLRGGATGFTGRVRDSMLRPIRRRQTPPPVVADPPTRGGADLEPWMF